MKATIITIGDEILIGQIVDTNSASIARHLNAAGIVVAEKESVGDDRDAIVAALRRAMDGSDVTILTGGLGPTKDDITKRTLAELFGCELVRDERVARHVRRMLESRGIAYNDLNRGQSLVPACCTVLFNAHGTAPGMWFERDGRVVVSLPGVPFEMEHLMQDEVMPRLKARFALRQIVHRTLITSGLAESMLAERIAGRPTCIWPTSPRPTRCGCGCRPTRSKAKRWRTKSKRSSKSCARSFPNISSATKRPRSSRSSTTCSRSAT